MRYLMLVLETPADPGDTEAPTSTETWVERHDASGARIMGERLSPQPSAVGVRVRGGETLVTDGPFAEAKEIIVGFDVLEAVDLDEAVKVAADHPMAYVGALELRPFWPFEPGEG